MEGHNKNKDKESIIHKSFTSLVKLIEKEKNNKNEEKQLDDNFRKEFFCCNKCYDKFIKVVNNIKNNKINLTKIEWEKYSSDLQNIIVQLVTYYYNLGLQNSTK